MHYYSFNIGDYVSSTQHLEPMEDLAYRRMLDLYYSNEGPLPSDIDKIARLTRMRSHKDCIAIVLEDFFTLEKDGYHNNGADKALELVYKKSETARKSAEARWNKNKDLAKKADDANALDPHCVKDANGMLHNTHNTIPKTHIKDLFDNERIIPLWNSFGCERHKGLTLKAEKALDKTYKHYCKSVEKGKEPKELNDWLESYLIKGFKPMIADHHRKFDDGKWAADLEFAIRLDTYDKVKNRV